LLCSGDRRCGKSIGVDELSDHFNRRGADMGFGDSQ
jgi:hypothetical protein